MQKLLPRVLLLPLMLLAMFVFAAPASAAQPWLPGSFDQHHRVYVDPALTNHPDYPVNLDGLEGTLDKLSREQGVEYYFVFVQSVQGAQVPPQYGGMTGYGRWQLDELVNKWSSQSGFPASRAQIILLARSYANPNAFVWAVNPGTEVTDKGANASYFNDAYFKNIRPMLPNDVKGWATTIATDTNGKWASTISARHFQAMLPIYIGIFVVLAIVIGAFLFFLFRYRKAVAALKKALDEWQPKITSVTTLFQQLNDPKKGYLDFLSNQKGRRESFTDETKVKYEAALKDYSAFVLRRQIASDLFMAAKAAFDGRKFIVSTGALNAALASLTTTQVVITGKEKKLTEITDAFGGTVEQWKMQPAQLLADINTLFNSVNAALARIKGAFEKASGNKTTIEATIEEVDALETKVTGAGLTWTPFEEREQAVRREVATVLADLVSNPIGKEADSTRINAGVVDLKGDIEHCLAIKAALPDTVTAIGTVRTRVATVRGTATSLAYPFIEGEKPGKEASATFLLTEEGHNPDDKLAEADEHVAACERELNAGEWEKAQAAKEQADAARKAANDLVTAALDAKAYIETAVKTARANKDTLAGKLPAAGTAAASLKEHFLAANFKGQTEKVETGQTVANGTEKVISAVRAAYYAQDFVSARATLEGLVSSIAAADRGLGEVHAKLAELEGLRSHARTQAADAVSKSQALKTKRNEKSFTTSAATDTSHKQLTPKVATLKANVDQDVADWPALAAEADSLVAQLVALDQAVDASERAYGTAKQKVSAVATAVRAAETECDDNDVLQPALDKLATAQSELRALQTTLQTEKQDWAALGTLADSKKNVADGAKQLAAQDKEDAKDARTAVRAASTLINQNEGSSVTRRRTGGYRNLTFTESASVNLSSAESELSSAQQCLRNRQWKKAKEHADRVAGKIEAAEEAAQRAADQALTTAIAIWVAANPEPRPEPTHTSSGGGFGGGFGGDTGNSIGGGDIGGSVGNSIGGGDSNFQ